MKIGVDLTRLDEARLATRAARLAAERARDRVAARASIRTEVSDGKRELGAAAGDLSGADE
ncbi:MAG: hypothetical protein M5U16_10365 [Hyphomicrobium sp.]|nr:hypothetical protein [Hyphomicrobium sp.]